MTWLEGLAMCICHGEKLRLGAEATETCHYENFGSWLDDENDTPKEDKAFEW